MLTDSRTCCCLLHVNRQRVVVCCRHQLSRVYPGGHRINSSNYDPRIMWNCGCHMLALNYQTAGEYTAMLALMLLPQVVRCTLFACDVIAMHARDVLCASDLAMQVNMGKFVQNGQCGYILQPDCFLDQHYDPFQKSTLSGVDPLTITLTVRHCSAASTPHHHWSAASTRSPSHSPYVTALRNLPFVTKAGHQVTFDIV